MSERDMNIAEKPIGFFDSGIGGLTVLKEAISLMPGEDYVYYADTKNAPYGTKSRDDVRRLVFKAAETLAAENIKMLVVACNTATSIAISDLRNMYNFPVIGMEPAVKPAVSSNGGGRVLVAATQLTLRESKFHNLIEQYDSNKIVDYLALPRLVEYAENLEFDSDRVLLYINRMLSTVRIEQYGTLVLGCTHYIYYRDIFRKVLPAKINIIDGNHGTVCHMKNVAQERGLVSCKGTGSITYFVSGKKADDELSLERFRILMNNAGTGRGES